MTDQPPSEEGASGSTDSPAVPPPPAPTGAGTTATPPPPPPGGTPPPPGGTPLPPPGGMPATGAPPPPGAPPIPGAPSTPSFTSPPPPGGAPGYTTPQFGTPGYTPGGIQAVPQPGQRVTNGLAIAALVCGILSLVMFWACFAGLALGIVGLVLGILGRNKAKQLPGEAGSGMALGGIITGAIGTVIGIGMVALLFIGDSATDDINSDPSDGVCNEDRWLQDPDC